MSVGIFIAPVSTSAPASMEYNSELLLTPASILKSLTTATAISVFGPEFRWETRVEARGSISSDGTLHGDLVIVGGGDPTIDSRHFSKEQPPFVGQVLEAVRRHGIRQVRGSVVTVSDAVPDGGPIASWEVEDIPWDYGAGAYAVNYSDNTFTLQLPSMNTTPSVPGLNIINRMSGTTDKVDVSRGVGSNNLTITGSLGQRKQASFTLAMPDPAAVLTARLTGALVNAGISVAGVPEEKADTAARKTLLVRRSLPLSQVGRSLMVRSDNLMAEATLRALAPGKSRGAALKLQQAHWRDLGVDLSICRIDDGSGLSRGNCITPRQLGQVLRIMASGQHRMEYVDLFARTGVDGTLRSFLSNNPRKKEFVLKSGSMGGVQCYAGYRLDPDTMLPTHVIVVMANHLTCQRTQLRKAIENLLLGVAY